MNNYIFIESKRKNKNGHISHLLRKIKENDSYYFQEVSVATGKLLKNCLTFDNENQIKEYDYRILDLSKERANLVGYNTKFADYIIGKIENGAY